PCLDERRLATTARAVDDTNPEHRVGFWLFDGSFPEMDDLREPVVPARGRQQVEEESGVVFVVGPQALGNYLQGALGAHALATADDLRPSEFLSAFRRDIGAVAADYRGPLDALLRFEGLQAVPNFLDREMGDLSDLGVIDVTSQRLTQRLILCTQDSMQCFAFRAL